MEKERVSAGARCLYVTSFWEKINNHPSPRLIPTHTLSHSTFSSSIHSYTSNTQGQRSPFTPLPTPRMGARLCATTRCLRSFEDEAAGFSTIFIHVRRLPVARFLQL